MGKKTGPKGPWKYDKDFHPDDFVKWSEQGKCITQIAKIWKVNQDTVHEWRQKHPEFSVALKKGKTYCAAWYMDLGQAAMIGRATIDGKPININIGMFVWMTKNILKWTDKVETQVEHTGEIKSGVDREQALKRIFKDTKSRTLARELAEHLCETEKKEDDDGKDSR